MAYGYALLFITCLRSVIRPTLQSDREVTLHVHVWRQNASFWLGLRSFEVCLKWFTPLIIAERDIVMVLLFKSKWRGNRSRQCCRMQPSCFPWTQPRINTFSGRIIYKGVQPPWSPNLHEHYMCWKMRHARWTVSFLSTWRIPHTFYWKCLLDCLIACLDNKKWNKPVEAFAVIYCFQLS